MASNVLSNVKPRCATATCRTLAHYTVWNNEVFHLHIFEFDDNYHVIRHFAAREETADTRFVEGILIIAPYMTNNDDIQKFQTAKTIFTLQAHGLSLRDMAKAIVDLQLYTGKKNHDKSKNRLFEIHYPTCRITCIL